MPFDFHDDVDAIADKLDGVDAIVFTAGARSRDLLQTDAFGPVKLATAAEKAGVRRYVQLSSIYALEPDPEHDGSNLIPGVARV